MARLLLISSFFHSFSSGVFACPYCFTDQDSPQIRSGTAGVMVMIGVVVFVLGVIASLALQWARRARAIERSGIPSAPAQT